MRAREFIIESKSADLYHGTSIESAEEILDSNIMITGDGSQGDEGQVSFSRYFSIAWQFANSHEPAGVIFVIDQLKLSQTLGKKLYPFDYLGGIGRGTPEAEEASRVNIPNFKRYIKQIIILLPTYGVEPGEMPEIDVDEYPNVFSWPNAVVSVDRGIGGLSARQYARYIKQYPASDFG